MTPPSVDPLGLAETTLVQSFESVWGAASCAIPELQRVDDGCGSSRAYEGVWMDREVHVALELGCDAGQPWADATVFLVSGPALSEDEETFLAQHYESATVADLEAARDSE